MLKRWSISNFKSINGQLDLDLAPLTIVCGANSSGKSTILQSMLTVAQTFRSSSQTRALILNGPLTRLGRFDDILHAGENSQAEDMSLGFSLLAVDQIANDDQMIELDATIAEVAELDKVSRKVAAPAVTYYVLSSSPVQAVKQNGFRLALSYDKDPPYERFGYRIVLKDGIPIDSPRVGDIDTTHVEIQGLEPVAALVEYRVATRSVDTAFRRMLDLISEDNLSDDVADELVPGEIAELFRTVSRQPGVKDTGMRDLLIQLAEEINVRAFAWRDLRHVIHNQGANRVGRKERRVGTWSQNDRTILRDRASGLKREWLDAIRAKDNTRAYDERYLPSNVRSAIDDLWTFWSDRFSYLGPLREDPKVVFAAPTDIERQSVGNKGEYTAAVLTEWGQSKVVYPIPPDKDSQNTSTTQEGTLQEAVGAWLHHMGLVDSVRTAELSKVGYEMTVASSGLTKPLDLMNVGVGVSQVLPTLVMCMIAPEDATLVLEQPELHLHPKVQSILGDFLLGISAMGKQCIVETHSEHLINRVRRRIAESRDDAVMNSVQMYFAQKPSTETQIITVEPNEYGAVPDWPEGFFDEAANETQLIIDAATEKRQEKMAAMRNRRRESR